MHTNFQNCFIYKPFSHIIKGFESLHLRQKNESSRKVSARFCFFGIGGMRTRGVRRCKHSGAIANMLAEVSSMANFFGNIRNVRKNANTEYPSISAKKRQGSTEPCRFYFLPFTSSLFTKKPCRF